MAQPQTNAAPTANSFVMSDREFAAIRELVGKLAGIVVTDQKRPMICSRLSRRLRHLGFQDFSSYLDFVGSSRGADEVGEFVNAVTTNLTSFFREAHHFTHLGEVVLPELAQRRQSRVRIWSSASSSGEEPYSIAMTVASHAQRAAFGDLKILATDLDTNMLARCRAGNYPAKGWDSIPQKCRNFLTRDQQTDRIQVSDALKAMIVFRQLNLIEPWPVRGPFDVIFCRNVLIYFDDITKRRLVGQFVELLPVGGVLYLGHSEALLGCHPRLKSEGRTIYRKVE